MKARVKGLGLSGYGHDNLMSLLDLVGTHSPYAYGFSIEERREIRSSVMSLQRLLGDGPDTAPEPLPGPGPVRMHAEIDPDEPRCP